MFYENQIYKKRFNFKLDKNDKMIINSNLFVNHDKKLLVFL